MFSVPVCNIFKETLLDGQLCYQADLNRIRDQVDKKRMVTEGFVFLLDYNENRMVEESDDENIMEEYTLLSKKEEHEDAMIYVETVGNNYYLVYETFEIENLLPALLSHVCQLHKLLFQFQIFGVMYEVLRREIKKKNYKNLDICPN